MTVESLATQLDLWSHICSRVEALLGMRGNEILENIAGLPVTRSHATGRLGSYVSRGGRPVCIRLQFAQEAENLKQTLLHEIAHACDHLSNQAGKPYRKAHGPRWREWAATLGTTTASNGSSEALKQLHQSRLKLVAVCKKCGAEFQRVRRLNRRRKYFHRDCGGVLRQL